MKNDYCFYSFISHEINNQLTAIQGYCELIKIDGYNCDREELESSIELIYKSGKNIQTINKLMHYYSKINEKFFEKKKYEVDINKLNTTIKQDISILTEKDINIKTNKNIVKNNEIFLEILFYFLYYYADKDSEVKFDKEEIIVNLKVKKSNIIKDLGKEVELDRENLKKYKYVFFILKRAIEYFDKRVDIKGNKIIIN